MYIMVPSLMIFDKATCSNKNEEVKLSEELSSLQISRNFIVEESLWGMNFGIVLLITEAEGILNCPLITDMHDDSIKFGIKSRVKTNCSNHERVSCK